MMEENKSIVGEWIIWTNPFAVIIYRELHILLKQLVSTVPSSLIALKQGFNTLS